MSTQRSVIMKSKLNQLYLMKLFIAIVQKGSFAGGARSIDVAAAKASKDISYLESSLDTILLSRSTRTLNITDAGELFYQSALDIVEMHSQMIDNLAMLKTTISGELRITAPALWGEVVLAPIIIAYRQRFPLVKFTADFSNDIIDIFKENIHIAFRSTNLQDEPYLARFIANDEFVLCASKEYLSSKTMPKTPQHLLELDFITLANNGSQFSNYWQHATYASADNTKAQRCIYMHKSTPVNPHS